MTIEFCSKIIHSLSGAPKIQRAKRQITGNFANRPRTFLGRPNRNATADNTNPLNGPIAETQPSEIDE